MQASDIETGVGGAVGKRGAQAPLGHKQPRRVDAAAAPGTPREEASHAWTIGSCAALAGVLTVALAALLGVPQLRDAGLRAPAIWIAVIALVILAAMLVLLLLERRKLAATLRALGETRQRLAYAAEGGSVGVWEWDVEAGQVHCDASWFIAWWRAARTIVDDRRIGGVGAFSGPSPVACSGKGHAAG
jgi:hypothetical protein